MSILKQDYSENGVSISQNTIKVNDSVTISYQGLLLAHGADEIFAHIGYGDTWDEKAFVPMLLEEGIFKATLKMKKAGTLHICFKDSADNWDNNSLKNYTFEIGEKLIKKAKDSQLTEKDKEEKATKKNSKKVLPEAMPKAENVAVKSNSSIEKKTVTKKTEISEKSKIKKK